VEPIVWTLFGERISRDKVLHALAIGRTFTPASMQAGIHRYFNRQQPSEEMDEGLYCPQHQARFETFRGYLQHYREMH
jgi:hypothetical protein